MSFFVTTNKGRKEITPATSWATTTTEQFQKMAIDWDGEDLVKLFSIISGMEYKALANTHDFALEEQLLSATKFVYNEPMNFKDDQIPTHIDLNGKQVRIPKSVGDLSIGQNIHVRQAIEKAKCPEELISFVTAIYLQTLYDETQDFDYHRAMELEQDILKLPITQTYPIGIFFLKKLTGYGGNILSRLNLLITRLLLRSVQRELD